MSDVPPGDPHPTGEDVRGRHELDSPIDLPPDPIDHLRAGAWTTVTVLAATASLCLLNAHSAVEWLDEMSPNALNASFRPAAASWENLTAATSLPAVRATVRRAWEAAQAKRFGSERPGQKGAGLDG